MLRINSKKGSQSIWSLAGTKMGEFAQGLLFERGPQYATRVFFKASGYNWEVRRQGELKIGLWRKTFQENKNPKRFVFIPGFGDTPLSWIAIFSMVNPILKRRYDEIVLLDFPGFSGALIREKAFHSMDLMMEQTSDVLDSLKPHTVMGHSLGGWLLAAYSGWCGKGDRPRNTHRDYTGPKKNIFVSPSGAFGNMRAIEKWQKIFESAKTEGFVIFKEHLFVNEPVFFKYYIPVNKRFFEKKEIIEFIDSIGKKHMVSSILGKIEGQVWMLWGEFDSIVPPDVWIPLWKRGFKSGPRRKKPFRAVVVKDTGHMFQLEKMTASAWALSKIMRDDDMKIPPDGKWNRFGWRVTD